ncbi:uncharacterized protein V1513DRAFT_451970 [Lipomyces chichibuensis]|uniref:uncharacterized protein n=1 Tax=Lipomyces chichibuensis TaxID=1546026 RepID=UPI003342EC42
MSSIANPSDCEQKTLLETLKTILRLSEGVVAIPLRYGNQSTDAIVLALAMLDYGYDPQSLSDNLWTHLTDEHNKIAELSQFLSPVGGSLDRVVNLKGITPKVPLNWEAVADRFQQSQPLKKQLEEWTSPFFYELLIPMKAKGKTPTPSDGSTSSRSRNLKQKLLDRDGWLSAVGRVMDLSAPWPMIPNQDYDHLEVAHIIPFSASSSSSFRTILSRFASQDICDLLTGQSINDPFNALLLDAKSHKFFDSFQFGLECQNGRYVLRKLGTKLPNEVHRHDDGDEIVFGRQSQHALPSPLLCNLHLAVGRVLHASGAAEAIDKILQDEDQFNSGDVEGDYWFRVGASYLQRKLSGLQGLDWFAPDRYEDHMDSSSEGDLSTTSRHAVYT